jgi:hypothetical protein
MPIINGKKVLNLPSSVSGDEIKKSIGENRPFRKVLVNRPNGNISVKDYEKITLSDQDKVQIVPDRVKAFEFSYGANKTEFQKKIIFSQVADIESKWIKSGIEIDKDFNWILITHFRLPDAWAAKNNTRTTKLLIIIPDQFPDLPTNGFYLPKEIGSPDGDRHLFSRGYGGAFGSTLEEINEMEKSEWKWYCTHIKPEAWSPARIKNIEDWKKGDNLWDILDTIKDVLTDPEGE